MDSNLIIQCQSDRYLFAGMKGEEGSCLLLTILAFKACIDVLDANFLEDFAGCFEFVKYFL